jgi:hypothetical protein
MKKWDKEDALKALDDLINQIPTVCESNRKSPSHMRWLANCLRILEEIFGQDSRYYLTIASFSWSETGNMLIQDYWNLDYELEKRHNSAFTTQMYQAKGLLIAAKDHLEQSEISEVYEGKNTSSEASELIRIINLGEKKLRKSIRAIPEKEMEIQDRFEDLLMANDIEYSREHPHIEYSIKKYIPDFSFAKISLAVEIKLCKKDEKGLIAQLNDDILAYKTEFRNLLFIIYDLGQIRDIETFKNSFESNSNVIIQVIKH